MAPYAVGTVAVAVAIGGATVAGSFWTFRVRGRSCFGAMTWARVGTTENCLWLCDVIVGILCGACRWAAKKWFILTNNSLKVILLGVIFEFKELFITDALKA